MWSAILVIGGWMAFCLFLLLYMRWVVLERGFFSGQDPEDWRPDFPGETPAPGNEQPKRLERLARLASLGRPA